MTEERARAERFAELFRAVYALARLPPGAWRDHPRVTAHRAPPAS